MSLHPFLKNAVRRSAASGRVRAVPAREINAIYVPRDAVRHGMAWLLILKIISAFGDYSQNVGIWSMQKYTNGRKA
jgi:hypothetical protein